MLKVLRRIIFGGLLLTMSVSVNSCWTFDQAARSVVDQAISAAVEQEMQAMLSGYTDMMLYQLAYTQMFHIGGYGLHHDEFEVGQGAVWRMVATEGDQRTVFTAERALLNREDDGSSWWFLKYVPEEGESIEYEVWVDRDLNAREMYLKDPESDEIRHHRFTGDAAEQRERGEGEESLEEAGYHTESFYPEDRDEYRIDRETITIGAGSFETEVLFHEEDGYEYTWWVTEEIPGELIKYQFKESSTGNVFEGEIIEMRDDYGFSLRVI